VTEGSVRANIFSENGREVAFHDMAVGSMFGELSAIDQLPRSAYVRALTDVSLAVLSRDDFLEVLSLHPTAMEAVLRHLSRLVRFLSSRVVQFSTLSVNHRVIAELLRIASECADGSNSAVIHSPPTHAEIATRVSTHRETVTREITELQKRGLVCKETGQLVIPDIKRLTEALRM
jgi:CRP-like cAMP-binding protein